MKRRFISVLLTIAMSAILLTSCSNGAATVTTTVAATVTTTAATSAETTGAATTTASSGSGFKVGMAIQSLSNPIWASVCTNLKEIVESNGGEMTYVACDSNITTQIQQVENLISSKVNVIVCQAADPAGIEDTLKTARDQGIKVIAWDDELTNSDVAYVIDNYALGTVIGEKAAAWINEKFTDGKCEVAILDYPQLPILLERGNGIVDAIKKNAPNAKIVAQTSAIDAAGGQTKMETIFQSNPDVKVVCCIGGGGAVGANEAAKAANKITDDFGIFAADASEQQLAAIKNNEGIRMSVMVTGGPDKMAQEIYDIASKLLASENLDKVYVREIFPINSENIDQYYTA